MIRFGQFLLTFLGLVSGTILFAQQSQHYLKRFSVEEGLAHTTAGRMCEDQYGFIWICTEDGLSRFDGYGFKNYNHRQDDPNSLPANWCGELFRDKDGNLWVITSSNKISMYNPASDNFISYSPGASQYYRNVRHEKEKNKLIYCSEKSVFIFHFDSRQFELIYTDSLLTYLDAQLIDNTLLMLTSKGFHEYDLSKKKLTRIITGLKEIDSPIITNFYPMLKPDSRGDIYIPSLKGIFRYNHKTRAVEYIKYIDTENGGRVELSSYTGAFFENDDILWIFSASKGAIRVDMTGKKRPVLYSDSPDTPIKYAINSNEVQNFYKDSKGKMIILTYRGININDENLGRFRFYAFNDDEKKSKTTEKYSFFLEDRNKNYYFSTSLDGIRIMENKKGFHDIVWLYDNFVRDMNITKGEYDKNIRILKENLTEIAIRDLLEDKTGNLWICTDFGVVFVSKKDGSVGLITESTSPVKLFAEQPGDIIQHQDESIWVLPFNGKVTKINADLSASQVIEMNPEMQPGIFHTYSGYFDKKNILWLGSTDQIVTYDLSSARAKSYRSHEILGNQAARFWLEPDDNTLLIGGTVRFIKLDRKSEKMTEFRFKYNGESAGKFFPIMAGVMQDDILWIGTYGGGVIKYNLKSGAQKNYRIKEGLSNEYILEILRDQTGCLWFSTNKGINKLDPATDRIEVFRSFDNTVSEEFNAGAALCMKNGIIVFGGTKGLTAFYPSELKKNSSVPPLMLTGYMIRSDNQKETSIIPQDSVITLDYDDNLFSVSFTALNFINPELNQYAYKLEGFDDQWISNGNRREVFFSNLDPGEYILKIAASNNDGVWNWEGASVKIIVNPPWWGTLWFRIVLAVSIMAFLWFLYNERINSIRRVEKARADEQIKSMQMLEEERIRTEQMIKESEIELKKEISLDLHDGLGTELSTIVQTCSNIIRDAEISENHGASLSNVSGIAQRAQKMIREVMWFLDPENESNSKLIGYFRDTFRHFPDQFGLEMNVGDDVFDHPRVDSVIKKNIYLIFRESLENVTKHSEAGKVEVLLSRNDGIIKLMITDNGKGFNPDSQFRGKGLINIKRRAERIKADIQIKSQPGGGTAIELSLDLNNY